jgi:hypothetical protein
MIEPDERTLTDDDIETVVRGSAGSLETDPDTTDDGGGGDGDKDGSDADDDATDEGGGDTDTTDS